MKIPAKGQNIYHSYGKEQITILKEDMGMKIILSRYFIFYCLILLGVHKMDRTLSEITKAGQPLLLRLIIRAMVSPKNHTDWDLGGTLQVYRWHFPWSIHLQMCQFNFISDMFNLCEESLYRCIYMDIGCCKNSESQTCGLFLLQRIDQCQ